MNVNGIISVSLVFFRIPTVSVGFQYDYEAPLLYQNITLESGRAQDFGRSTCACKSDEEFGQDHSDWHRRAPCKPFTPEIRPLVLTPYVVEEKFHEGIKAAKVKTAGTDIDSYSGFFELNNRHSSHMFFWYFPPLAKKLVGKSDTPVIMWVHGGVEGSVMFSAFRENGPLRLEPNGTLTFNKWSWAERAHLVYFDSPVGAGYSFTSRGKYATTQEKAATDLYIALLQYLRLFGLMKNPLFIVGQAYAGKTVSALGGMIHKRKKTFPVNLQGVAIGNGFVDPPNMLEYGKFLYQLGFVDEGVRNELHTAHDKIQAFLEGDMETEALHVYTEYIQSNLEHDFPVIDQVTALASKLNFKQVRKGVNEEALLNTYLNERSTQKALHATGVPFGKNKAAALRAIRTDLLKSQVHNLKLLMNHYRVLLYNGQMSVQNPYPLVLEYLNEIRWRDGKKYRRAERVQWWVNGEVAGYFKTGGLFTELLIRNAGCHVSVDQPKLAQHMINKFIYGQDLNSE